MVNIRFCAAIASGLIAIIAVCARAEGENDQGYRGVIRLQATDEQLPQFAEAHFEAGCLVYPPSHRSFVPRVPLLKTTDWPASFAANEAKLKWWQKPGEHLHFEEFTNPACRSRSVDYMRRRFTFISAPGQPEPKPARARNAGAADSMHMLVCVAHRADGPQTVVLQNLRVDSPGRALEFEIASYNGMLVLVYATADGVFQRIGRLNGDGIQFFEPKRIHNDGRDVMSLQLRSSTAGIHLLWAVANGESLESTLKYMRSTDPKVGWEPTQMVSDNAVQTSAALTADDSAVYIAWSEREPGSSAAKLIMKKSGDAGANFASPVLVSDPKDSADPPIQVLLYPAADHILLLWRDEAQSPTQGGWKMATIDRDLTLVTVGGAMTNEAFRDAYNRRLKQACKY